MTTVVLPGLIDMHVHLREPGLTHKGDMETETRAALAGGVHTVCDMPNTVPPTVTIDAFRDKVGRAERLRRMDAPWFGSAHHRSGRPCCDVRLYFGATRKEHLKELSQLFADPALKDLRARCCGLKLFLDHSTGDQGIDRSLVEEALKITKDLGIVAVCHCEDPDIRNKFQPSPTLSGGSNRRLTDVKDVRIHSLMRSPECEEQAVSFILDLVRKTGAHVHPTHISTAGAIDLIRAAKRDGLPVTCDVSPHHLFLTTNDYASLGTLGKMNPPLRTAEDQAALWEGIHDGTVDCIATDHAPHTLEEKNNPDPLQAPSGVPGVETMLPLLLTVAAESWPHPESRSPKLALSRAERSEVHFSHADIRRLCFDNPNKILQLGKKAPEEGGDAITVDLEKEWVIRGKELHSKCQWTPYEGWRVVGRVQR